MNIDFNEEKNQLLKATRGICFDDVIQAIQEGALLVDISHPNSTYPHQKMFVVNINYYAYAVPYVLDNDRKCLFLKTVYPSRLLTKKYLKGT